MHLKLISAQEQPTCYFEWPAAAAKDPRATKKLTLTLKGRACQTTVSVKLAA